MLCTAAAIGIGLYTLGAEFPARALALEGEAAIAVVVAGLVLASLRRQRPSVRADRSPRAQLVAIVLRLFVGVPVFAFALVVAASGFAA
jgi:hypothetical protein